MKKLTQKRLKELLDYDPETGIFKWKKSKSNRVKNGSIAGYENILGYIEIRVEGKPYLGHRLAWFYVYSYFPECGLDHKNRIKSDNRIKNLREITQQCNSRNCGLSKNNTSGVTGVHWSKRERRWISQIMVNRKLKYLGNNKKLNDAVLARWKGEKKYNWPNCNSSSPAFLYLKANGLIKDR
jgi:hypothetical protein